MIKSTITRARCTQIGKTRQGIGETPLQAREVSGGEKRYRATAVQMVWVQYFTA